MFEPGSHAHDRGNESTAEMRTKKKKKEGVQLWILCASLSIFSPGFLAVMVSWSGAYMLHGRDTLARLPRRRT